MCRWINNRLPQKRAGKEAGIGPDRAVAKGERYHSQAARSQRAQGAALPRDDASLEVDAYLARLREQIAVEAGRR